MKTSSSRKAFTLIELGVVLVIIAILIAGSIQGAGMIRSSRLNNARSLNSKSPVPEISGLIVWYETSSKDSFMPGQAYDGSQITQWRDISPASLVDKKNTMTKNAITPAAVITYKADGINKVPTIYFGGSGGLVSTPLFQGATSQATVFFVFRPTYNPSATLTVLLDDGLTAYALGVKNTSIVVNAGTFAEVLGTYALGKDYVLAVTFNGALSKVYVNEATTGGAVNPGTANQLTRVVVGSGRNGDSGFIGYISEVIIYNRPLKLQERKDVMKYLSRKYGIAVTGI